MEDSFDIHTIKIRVKLANVYSKPASLYEVRIDDNSVYVQITG